MHQTVDGRYARLDRITWYKRDVLQHKSVIVVGAGSLGSHVLPHLVLNGVGRVLIIDHDRVETHNLPMSLLYTDEDLGFPKAEAAAKRLRRMNPDVSVEYLVADIDNVGLAEFRYADAVLGAVDNRLARMHINGMVWKTRTAYFDGSIDGQSLSGRVLTIIPPDSCCMECSWYDQDYAALKYAYPCETERVDTHSAPTFSTATAATAGLLVGETLKFLLGLMNAIRPGTERRFDLLHYSMLETRIEKRADCLCDHDLYIDDTMLLPAVDAMTLHELFDRIAETGLDHPMLRVDFHRDYLFLVCNSCSESTLLRRKSAGRSTTPEITCSCGGTFHTFDVIHSIRRDDIAVFRNTRLSDIGVPAADIISASDGRQTRWYEFEGARTQQNSVEGVQ